MPFVHSWHHFQCIFQFRLTLSATADGNEKNARGLNRAMLLEHVEKINQKLAAVDQKLELVEMEIKIPNKEFIVFTNVTRTAAAALK